MRITNKDFVDMNDPILHKRINKIELPLDDDLKSRLFEMRRYIKDSLDDKLCEKYDLSPSVGIAANQVGLDARACAVYITDDELVVLDLIMINPTILSHSSQEAFLEVGEGCLSVKETNPGFIYRYNKIKVAYFTVENEKKYIEVEGFLAIVLQHEIDHLNGILYTDKINKDNPFIKKDNSIMI